MQRLKRRIRRRIVEGVRFTALLLWVAPIFAQPVVERVVSVEYPPLAQQARISGGVELRCAVGEGGEAVKCEGVSGHPLLVQAAVASALKWRFRPGLGQVVLPFEFALAGAPVRRRPKVEFTFEFPNRVWVMSELPCADHGPCTPEEMEEAKKAGKGKKKTRFVP